MAHLCQVTKRTVIKWIDSGRLKGYTIPGSRHRVDGPASNPLTQALPGPVTVRRISEKIELDDEALRLLARAQLTPGSTATVTGTDVDGVHVETGAGEQVVPRAVAALMWVVPA